MKKFTCLLMFIQDNKHDRVAMVFIFIPSVLIYP